MGDADQNGDQNESDIYQEGTSNYAGVDQDIEDYSNIIQFGDNKAWIYQNGGENDSFVFQDGYWNEATVSQTGVLDLRIYQLSLVVLYK